MCDVILERNCINVASVTKLFNAYKETHRRKTYKCTYYKNCFVHKTHLIRHTRVHTGEMSILVSNVTQFFFIAIDAQVNFETWKKRIQQKMYFLVSSNQQKIHLFMLSLSKRWQLNSSQKKLYDKEWVLDVTKKL